MNATTSRFARIRDEILALTVVVTVVSLIFGGLYVVFDKALSAWTNRDLDNRGELIWRAAAAGEPDGLGARIEAFADDDYLVGILACIPGRTLVSKSLAGRIGCSSQLARNAMAADGKSITGRIGGHNLHLNAYLLGDFGQLVIVQDPSFIESRRERMLQVLVLGAYAAALALLMLIRFGIIRGQRGVVRAARDLLRRIDSGDDVSLPTEIAAELRPLVTDFNDTLARLRRHRVAERDDSGPARLRALVNNSDLGETSIVVVANREPYEHDRGSDGVVRVRRPPSGLVTGIEPVLRATGGTWIAHGGGSADREHADAQGRLAVPPEKPDYVLRRVWLTEEEYDGYYLGFANEGLWPLCHIAHTRPTFRSPDWRAYQMVNEKFAQAAVSEGTDSLVLVQDYHFALVPRLIRDAAPSAAVSLFWHIPWPNSEVIGICPWREQILDGMLGADVLGFHTRFHCLNFLETVQRYLECRVDLATMSVEYRGTQTRVRAYPISVEWPYPAATREEGAKLRQSLGIPRDVHVAVGVDRSDYTKGLLERVAAVEALLASTPRLRGKFVFVQLAAPSRTRIKKYRDLISELEEAVTRVNRRFGTATWKPIQFQMRNFSPQEVRQHYAMADSALVTPLHDGMNLVAKEYVASCTDADGALILSAFAGAAQELEGALIVNPYDADAVAAAILRAIEMPSAERRARMTAMREQIAKSSIYDWSSKLLRDLVDVRVRRDRLWPRTPVAKHAIEAAV
jgi:trehalose 6-phosphate synthase